MGPGTSTTSPKPCKPPFGNLIRVRWLQTVLIALLMFGQVHLCRASYALPDGRTCLTCPSLGDDRGGVINAPHGDCHDCCTLRSCGGGEHAKKSNGVTHAPIQIEVYFHEAICLVFSDPFVPRHSFFHVESHPAHGPPSRALSRGPPCSTSA